MYTVNNRSKVTTIYSHRNGSNKTSHLTSGFASYAIFYSKHASEFSWSTTYNLMLFLCFYKCVCKCKCVCRGPTKEEWGIHVVTFKHSGSFNYNPVWSDWDVYHPSYSVFESYDDTLWAQKVV